MDRGVLKGFQLFIWRDSRLSQCSGRTSPPPSQAMEIHTGANRSLHAKPSSPLVYAQDLISCLCVDRSAGNVRLFFVDIGRSIASQHRRRPNFEAFHAMPTCLIRTFIAQYWKHVAKPHSWAYDATQTTHRTAGNLPHLDARGSRHSAHPLP